MSQFDRPLNPARLVTDLFRDARDVVLGAAVLSVMRCVWRYQRTQYDTARAAPEAPRPRSRDSFLSVTSELS